MDNDTLEPATVEGLREATDTLLGYCREAGWAGWDPYDGLNSRLFQAIPLLQNKLCRLAFIQFIKRSPVNLRRLVGVVPMQNPKGVALFATCVARLSQFGLADLAEAKALADRVLELRIASQEERWCWGYHFDWQTRGVLVPTEVPNIVCTTFAAHSLLDVFDLTQDPRYLEAAVSAACFISDELAQDLPPDGFCIRYFTLCDSTVHNASLLGAALLARIYSHTNEERLVEVVESAARYSLDRQRHDGSWPYAESSSSAWVDSFHTGYNLLALREIGRHVAIPGLEDAVQLGFQYYLDHFFRGDGAVRYFHDRTFPIDAHSLGHAMLTLSEFSDQSPKSLDLALQVWDWSKTNMLSKDGSFYYQKRKCFTNRISYIRWSQAWMLRGMVELTGKLSPGLTR